MKLARLINECVFHSGENIIFNVGASLQQPSKDSLKQAGSETRTFHFKTYFQERSGETKQDKPPLRIFGNVFLFSAHMNIWVRKIMLSAEFVFFQILS